MLFLRILLLPLLLASPSPLSFDPLAALSKTSRLPPSWLPADVLALRTALESCSYGECSLDVLGRHLELTGLEVKTPVTKTPETPPAAEQGPPSASQGAPSASQGPPSASQGPPSASQRPALLASLSLSWAAGPAGDTLLDLSLRDACANVCFLSARPSTGNTNWQVLERGGFPPPLAAAPPSRTPSLSSAAFLIRSLSLSNATLLLTSPVLPPPHELVPPLPLPPRTLEKLEAEVAAAAA
ncbi:hypothetical protein TeGR_g15317, partial [Tetraparma gracilis]